MRKAIAWLHRLTPDDWMRILVAATLLEVALGVWIAPACTFVLAAIFIAAIIVVYRD